MIHYSIFSGTLMTAVAKWWGSRFIWASTWCISCLRENFRKALLLEEQQTQRNIPLTYRIYCGCIFCCFVLGFTKCRSVSTIFVPGAMHCSQVCAEPTQHVLPGFLGECYPKNPRICFIIGISMVYSWLYTIDISLYANDDHWFIITIIDIPMINKLLYHWYIIDYAAKGTLNLVLTGGPIFPTPETWKLCPEPPPALPQRHEQKCSWHLWRNGPVGSTCRVSPCREAASLPLHGQNCSFLRRCNCPSARICTWPSWRLELPGRHCPAHLLLQTPPPQFFLDHKSQNHGAKDICASLMTNKKQRGMSIWVITPKKKYP